ncbi:MAG TPA: hypothetical protein VEH05_16000 [Streptosporangiaceae bacterium]|nr:hypothetical protein [Streptosporangiaceae bacterium]
MSPGSEPERDDTGLPPVDIEIPDDARELERDVQAYHRELRALRRHQRRTRWHRSVGRDGIALPLLACCLILALITGTLLTVFTATSEQNLTGLPNSGTSALSTGHGGSAPAGRSPDIVVAGLLPPAAIAVDGRAPVPLDALRQAMIVLVPPGCNCASTLAWLADVATSAHASAYVVYNRQTKAEVQRLYGQLDSRSRAALVLADDTSDALTRPGSFPPGISAAHLTAILVAPDRTARYASGLSPSDSSTELIQAIID